MNPNEIYAAWKNARKQVDVDAGFSTGVMKRIARHQRPPARRRSPAGRRRGRWWPQTVAALLVAGLAVGILRTGLAIAVVLLSCTGGY